MAQQNQDPSNVNSTRYTERRLPQFIGGEVDPSTGNLVPGTRGQAAGQVQPDDEVITPAQPVTRLAAVGNPAPAPGFDYTSLLGAAASLGSKAFSGGSSGGGSGGGNPVDNLGIGGGGGSSGGGGGGSYFDLSGGADSSGNGGGGGGGGGFDIDLSGNSSGGGGGFDTSGSSGSGGGGGFDTSGSSGSGGGGADSSGNSGGGGGGGGGAYTDFLGNSYSVGGPGGSDVGAGMNFSTVICTELHRQGYLTDAQIEADRSYGAAVRQHYPHVYAGYLAWAPLVVTGMQRSARFGRAIAFIGKPWASHLSWVASKGQSNGPSLGGLILLNTGWHLCGLIGRAMSMRRRRSTATAA